MSVCELSLIKNDNTWGFYLIIYLTKEPSKKATTTISKVRLIFLHFQTKKRVYYISFSHQPIFTGLTFYTLSVG